MSTAFYSKTHRPSSACISHRSIASLRTHHPLHSRALPENTAALTLSCDLTCDRAYKDSPLAALLSHSSPLALLLSRRRRNTTTISAFKTKTDNINNIFNMSNYSYSNGSYGRSTSDYPYSSPSYSSYSSSGKPSYSYDAPSLTSSGSTYSGSTYSGSYAGSTYGSSSTNFSSYGNSMEVHKPSGPIYDPPREKGDDTGVRR